MPLETHEEEDKTNGLATRIKAETLAGMLGYGGERWLSLQLTTQHAGYIDRAHISVRAFKTTLRIPVGTKHSPRAPFRGHRQGTDSPQSSLSWLDIAAQ